MDAPRVSRLGHGFRWPGGRKIALIFNVAYEAWSDGKAPGIGPMGNPLPHGAFDANALSWGNYGAEQGIARLLRILDRNAIRASVMVSGILAERVPESVRAIAEAGHEIAAHSYAQDIVPITLDMKQDRENIAKTTEAIASVTGQRPKGWISPRGTAGPQTLRLLVEAGYAWHSDVLDDDRPYLQFFEEGQLLAIPFTMDINDLPHAMRFGRTPRQFVELFDDFLAHAAEREDVAIIMDVTAHTHCYGRPGGAWAYEEIARMVRGRDDIWIATRQDIADHAMAALGGAQAGGADGATRRVAVPGR